MQHMAYLSVRHILRFMNEMPSTNLQVEQPEFEEISKI